MHRVQKCENVLTDLKFYSSVSFFCALQITVYDQEYFQGRRMEFTASCQNIMECGMENIRSLKVECGAYVSTKIFLIFCIYSLDYAAA